MNCWLSDQVLCFCFVLTVMKTKLIDASKGIVLAIISVSVFSPVAGVCSHVLVSPSSCRPAPCWSDVHPAAVTDHFCGSRCFLEL